ncbi:hypothetical protein AVEN_56551-1 [Araneus ventricosus]|uniref:RNase H type-1 domain-containing protein n=1 Tax=Araneus ventricosus TaxID=182803 RepID=A0A4Y2HGU6_ARAVE|nr:hypothetical protein AVEN_56551-1 [Araneus ventricosus]
MKAAAVPGPLTLATILATWRQIDDSRKCNPFLDISIRKGNMREYTRKFLVTSRPVGENWTVFQAELIALRESIKFAKNLNTDQNIKIPVDNKASILALSNLKTPNKIAQEISKILLDHSNIDITCIKAQVVYKGNEVADNLAKRATENGIPYSNIQLPRCFIKGPLKSLMFDKWQNEWTEGVTGRDIYNLIPRVKMRMEPWRKEEIIFVGHRQFPTYLHGFNLITSEYCNCGRIESNLHYATECPLTESWHLRKSASDLIHVWLRQVAGKQQSRNKIYNIVRIMLANSQLFSPDHLKIRSANCSRLLHS